MNVLSSVVFPKPAGGNTFHQHSFGGFCCLKFLLSGVLNRLGFLVYEPESTSTTHPKLHMDQPCWLSHLKAFKFPPAPVPATVCM